MRVGSVAAIHDPGPKARRVDGVLAPLRAGWGLAIAVRHVRIPHFPPPVSGCVRVRHPQRPPAIVISPAIEPSNDFT
jgi:hypothetical protein